MVARKKKLKAEFLGAGKEAIIAAKKSGRAVSDVIEVRTIRSNGQLHLLVLHCGYTTNDFQVQQDPGA